MTTNRIEIVDNGVMLTDYFHGTSGVWLNIYFDNETTIKDIIESLESEVNMVWDYIEGVAEYHDFTGNLEESIDECINDIKEENKGRMQEIVFSDIELSEDEDYDDPVLILTIEFLQD